MQDEEITALEAIYGEDFQETGTKSSFSIKIASKDNSLAMILIVSIYIYIINFKNTLQLLILFCGNV